VRHPPSSVGVQVRQCGEVLGGGLPQTGADVGEDLRGAGRAGDHTAHPPLGSKPTERNVEDPDAALLGVGVDRVDAVPVRGGQPVRLAVGAQTAACRGRLTPAVLAGEQPVGQREVRESTTAVDCFASMREPKALVPSPTADTIRPLSPSGR
jgi:hypothetical protein